MDRPPKQGAEIIDLFPRPKKSPEQLGAEVIDLSAVRRDRNNETLGISPDTQGAQIIELPTTPSEIRQEVSKLVGGFFAKKENDSEESNPQNHKETAEKIANLLDKVYERPDDKPSDNCTKKLGECILRLTVLDPRTAKILSTPGVSAELERIISLSRHPTRRDHHTASMAEIAWQYLVTKSAEDNTDPEPPSIA